MTSGLLNAFRHSREPLELALGQGEGHRDRRDLVDGDDAGRVTGADEVAGIDQAHADPPGNRGDDARVVQVDLRGRDRALIDA